MSNLKITFLMLAAGAVGFGAGFATPERKMYQITLDEYQGYVCGYVDGQISVLSKLPPEQSMPTVDHAKCDGAAARRG